MTCTVNQDIGRVPQPNEQSVVYLADSLRTEQDRSSFEWKSNMVLWQIKCGVLRRGQIDRERLFAIVKLMGHLRDFVMRWKVRPLSLCF